MLANVKNREPRRLGRVWAGELALWQTASCWTELFEQTKRLYAAFGVKSWEVDLELLLRSCNHLGVSQLTIHLTPNLSLTIPNASAQ